MSNRVFAAVATAFALAFAAASQLIPNEYFFTAAYTVLQFVILATAWNILGGYTGYVNFGSAAFFAIGAYSTVALYNAFKAPLLLMIVAGTLVAGVDLWGGVSRKFNQVVDREGRVSLPEVGPVLVAGKSLGEVQQSVQKNRPLFLFWVHGLRSQRSKRTRLLFPGRQEGSRPFLAESRAKRSGAPETPPGLNFSPAPKGRS